MDVLCQTGFSILNAEHWEIQSHSFPMVGAWGWGEGEVHGLEGRNLWLFQNQNVLSSCRIWVAMQRGRERCVGPLEYRSCFRNGRFIRCEQSVTTQLSCCSFFCHIPLALAPGPPLSPHADTLTPCSILLPLHLTLPCFPGGFTKKQPGLHGNVKTAEKWQLNAAAPHLISTLALTEQIMGNNTPLCCGKMKCFSRRLSCWGFICYCTSTDFSLLPSVSFYSFFSVAELFSLLHFFPVPPFYSSSYYTSLFSLPLFFPLWITNGWDVKAYIYNNSSYLHNDLQLTKRFQIHFLFSCGWWDNHVRCVELRCRYLFYRF